MRPETLVELLDAGEACAPPEKAAVIAGGGALAFGELRRGADGIAAWLAGRGVGRGDRVGIWMEKTPACVEAIAGVLRAGAAYVPLDPRSPAPRCAAIARDCGLAALVVDAPRLEALGEVTGGLALRALLVQGAAPAALEPLGPVAAALEDARGATPVALPRPAPADLAYVLYTSGSTGTPKGVAHTHASGAAFATWVQERFAVTSADVFSSHAPFHFDLSISDLYASLGAGASVRLVSAAEAMMGAHLARSLGPWGITVWYSVPSALVAMLESGELEGRPPPAALRLVFFAGEVFPMPQLRRLRRALPAVELVNLFGPTETNVCTYHVVPPALPEEEQALPIGIACENLETFVLDDEGREVSGPGAEGTLWARGGNIMLGYWGDPARTAKVLGPDPRGRPGLACNTGDRVRVRPDGAYAFHGRRDHLVKTRGYRVELGEIEAILASHPGVREAVAVPLPDPAIGNRIVATVVPSAGARVDALALRRWVGSRLPNYMVPAAIELRGELPRTSTGKADRARLGTEWRQKEGEA